MGSGALCIEFCGEWYVPDPDGEFVIGRGDDADLFIDDNAYLHRRFLTITCRDGVWWLKNVGTTLAATVTNGQGSMQAWLSPQTPLPLFMAYTRALFTAGSTTYEVNFILNSTYYSEAPVEDGEGIGATTIAPLRFTLSQKQVMLALAEPMLRRDGVSLASIPTSSKAAERLGWSMTKFNRKLDNVCDKLDRHGVAGLRAGGGKLATNRRARLVEHAVSSRLITTDDLPLLDVTSETEL
ncbi:hypothetical protein JT358_12315 [Micrococcales bacterium 31B]|nr:hypothetical protein [Micrococcales bacterium 31B]